MATIQEKIKEKLSVFMASKASNKPHIGILVEGFLRNKDDISFSYNKKIITIPIKEVLFPKKKKVNPEDYVDFKTQIIWVFLKGTLVIDRTSGTKSADCYPTCMPHISIPIIPTREQFQLAVPTYIDFDFDFSTMI